MPEPDFDLIARDIVDALHIPGYDDGDLDGTQRRLVEQLRLVWNARGAADAELRKAVETVLDTFTRDEAQGYRSRDRQYAIEVLGRALKNVAVESRASVREPT